MENARGAQGGKRLSDRWKRFSKRPRRVTAGGQKGDCISYSGCMFADNRIKQRIQNAPGPQLQSLAFERIFTEIDPIPSPVLLLLPPTPPSLFLSFSLSLSFLSPITHFLISFLLTRSLRRIKMAPVHLFFFLLFSFLFFLGLSPMILVRFFKLSPGRI